MLEDMLIDTVLVNRLQVAKPASGGNPARRAPQDAGGGFVSTYLPDAVPLICSVQPKPAERNVEHDKQGASIRVDVYFSQDPAIGVKDQLLWLTADGVSKANSDGEYPIITLEGRDISMAGRNEGWKLVGYIRPER